jgi:hypothetical protein
MSEAWAKLYQLGLAAYGEGILAGPERFRSRVEGFLRELSTARESLLRVRALGVDDPRIRPLEERYQVLAGGLVSPPAAVEGPPVLLVVAGLGLGIGAIAWAVAAYQYAVHLREQTALLEKELRARVEASKEGRTLAPSTLTPRSVAPLVAVGAVMLGVVGWAWWRAP